VDREIRVELTPISARRLVRRLLAQELDIDEDELRDDADLMESYAADSLDALVLAVGIEDATGYSISDADLMSVRTVDDAVALLCRIRS
jgi:acyl carrier protein